MNIYKSICIVLSILFFIICTNSLLDNYFYKNIKTIENPNDLLVLVNKNNKLDKNYIPTDLELINVKYSNEGKLLRREAKDNFEKLSNRAYKLGYKIIAVSAYRDYEYQEELYNEYVSIKGKKGADNCSARAGHSEHQTGLSVDVMGSNNDYDKFIESKEFNWMINNSYKYGFILRYPKGKEYITGFKYEPWHYRYVGKKIAKIIHKKNITLEEYLKYYK